MVGGAALGCGVFGLAGVGLALMSVRIGVGVVSGELNQGGGSDGGGGSGSNK